MKPSKQTIKRRKLIAETEKLWGQVVFREWGNQCELCERLASKPHHFIPKSRAQILRFDPQNGVPLCFPCHHRFHYTGDPRIIDAIIQKRGKEWKDYLFKKGNEINRSFYTLDWIKEQQNKLKEYLNDTSPKICP